jgi:hypothetical protein
MKRAVIAMCGPNAIGKTTAARRWAAEMPYLTACLCDSKAVVRNGVECEEDASWKSADPEVRAGLAQRYSTWPGVVLVESASGYGLRIAEEMRADHWIILTAPPAASLDQLRSRAVALGKPFRDDYWTLTKVGYESERRLLNYARSKLPDNRWTQFVIENQTRDWPVVDKFAKALISKYHSTLVRSGVVVT